MHVPDGFLDAPTSLATGVVAAAGVAVALRGARRELDDRTAPMAGLVAAFVFAAQMMNFPVGAGTSGHLLGGALAAVLVGPFTAALCLSVVLLVQACSSPTVGSPRSAPTSRCSPSSASASAGSSSAACGRCCRSGCDGRAGGRVRRARLACPSPRWPSSGCSPSVARRRSPLGAVLTAMLGWHIVIGLGEALITALVVGSVVAVRPDLVYGARPRCCSQLETAEVRTREVAA